jgi:hypothetical protein
VISDGALVASPGIHPVTDRDDRTHVDDLLPCVVGTCAGIHFNALRVPFHDSRVVGILQARQLSVQLITFRRRVSRWWICRLKACSQAKQTGDDGSPPHPVRIHAVPPIPSPNPKPQSQAPIPSPKPKPVLSVAMFAVKAIGIFAELNSRPRSQAHVILLSVIKFERSRPSR